MSFTRARRLVRLAAVRRARWRIAAGGSTAWSAVNSSKPHRKSGAVNFVVPSKFLSYREKYLRKMLLRQQKKSAGEGEAVPPAESGGGRKRARETVDLTGVGAYGPSNFL